MSNAEKIFDSFSYKDYKNWGEGVRCELINGEVFMMSAPDERHHDIVTDIYIQLRNRLTGSLCKPFIAPFDVRLFPREDESDDTVVQPDVFVVCDSRKLSDGKACRGAPDFVVEVTSPGTKIIDLFTKKDLYYKAGVKEYWIVGPNKMGRHILENGVYVETVYDVNFSGDEEIPLSVLPGCSLKIKL